MTDHKGNALAIGEAVDRWEEQNREADQEAHQFGLFAEPETRPAAPSWRHTGADLAGRRARATGARSAPWRSCCRGTAIRARC